MTRDQDDIGFGFSDSCSNRAYANFGDEFDINAGFRIGILEIVNELCHVLNRVDVMVRRRRDKAYTRGGTTHLGNCGKYLVTR